MEKLAIWTYQRVRTNSPKERTLALAEGQEMGNHTRKLADANCSAPTKEEKESGLAPLCMAQRLPRLFMSHGEEKGATLPVAAPEVSAEGSQSSHDHPAKQVPFPPATSPRGNEAEPTSPKGGGPLTEYLSKIHSLTTRVLNLKIQTLKF